jgi:hypothetical protein
MRDALATVSPCRTNQTSTVLQGATVPLIGSGDTTLPTGRAFAPISRTGVTLMGGGEATRALGDTTRSVAFGDTTRSLCGANAFGDAARTASTSATMRRAPDFGEGRRKALPTPGSAGAPRGVPGRGTRKGSTIVGLPRPLPCVLRRAGAIGPTANSCVRPGAI